MSNHEDEGSLGNRHPISKMVSDAYRVVSRIYYAYESMWESYIWLCDYTWRCVHNYVCFGYVCNNGDEMWVMYNWLDVTMCYLLYLIMWIWELMWLIEEEYLYTFMMLVF